jgi:hypothetical protein
MPDARDLRAKAEAALEVWTGWRTPKNATEAAAIREFRSDWHPGIALAALDVISAAEALCATRGSLWMVEEAQALDAALATWREAK